jgi:predicted trehalose synthase
MLPFAPNVMQFASGAGDAFAPALTSLEPTLAEAAEEHRRAKSYRESAWLLGGAAGIAVGLLVFARHP